MHACYSTGIVSNNGKTVENHYATISTKWTKQNGQNSKKKRKERNLHNDKFEFIIIIIILKLLMIHSYGVEVHLAICKYILIIAGYSIPLIKLQAFYKRK